MYIFIADLTNKVFLFLFFDELVFIFMLKHEDQIWRDFVGNIFKDSSIYST
jgi:hypothetical protein